MNVRDGQGVPAQALRWAPVVVALVTVAVLAAPTWQDAGAFALIALGVPLVCAAAPILPLRSSRGKTVVNWAAALLLTTWSLLLGLGIGLFLLPTAVLLLIAAIAAQEHPTSDLRGS